MKKAAFSRPARRLLVLVRKAFHHEGRATAVLLYRPTSSPPPPFPSSLSGQKNTRRWVLLAVGGAAYHVHYLEVNHNRRCFPLFPVVRSTWSGKATE